MLSSDRGFSVIPREDLSPSRAMQVRDPDVDQIAIPKRAILLLEKQQAPGAVHARFEARRVQVHERKQRGGLGNGANRMLLEKHAQTNRLLAQLATDHRVRLSRAVPLREQQIENLEDRRKPTRKLLDAGRLDLLDCSRSAARARCNRL